MDHAQTPSTTAPSQRRLVDYTQRGKRLSEPNPVISRMSSSGDTMSELMSEKSGYKTEVEASPYSVKSITTAIPSTIETHRQARRDSSDSLEIEEKDYVDFLLKIPSPNQRRRSSDLRERFSQHSKSSSSRRGSLLQSALADTLRRSRRSNSSISTGSLGSIGSLGSVHENNGPAPPAA